MNTINITTPQNIDVEYELGSLGDRMLGTIIDWAVLIAYVILALFLIGFTGRQFLNGYEWLMVVLVLPLFFYDLLCELLLNGQSVGKKVMGIKVISLNGSQPSFGQYFNRWVFRLIDFTITSNLLALVMVAVTEKKQRLGDVIAGTVLVKTRPRTQMQHTFYEPVDPATYRVTYPEVVNLNDGDIQLIKEVILNVNRSGNSMLALQAQQKIEQTLQIMSKQPEPRLFLQVILADYNHVTSQL
ncbi:MAG: hypothetical protein JWQ40_1061 [Segetibacter sp.]|nr:hypothetical protein [Segetibacter sp.]